MPIYNCECCNYSTQIKTQYSRHTNTSKHLNNIKNIPVNVSTNEVDTNEVDTNKVCTNKVCDERIDMLYDEIAFLKNEIAFLKKDNAEMKTALQECKYLNKDNAEIKTALQECNKLIMDMKTYMPTSMPPPPSPQPQPQPIIIQTNQPSPPEKKETCNPLYHCKDLNEDPKLKSILGVDTYFKIAGDVEFEFDDLREESDIRIINKNWLLIKLTNFVSKNKENIPFRYYKNSLYYKNEQGSWEREPHPDNKGEKLSNGTYKHSIIVKKFIFIIRNRIIKHLDEQLGDKWRLRNFEDLYSLMEKVTLNLDTWRNSEIANQLQDLLI